MSAVLFILLALAFGSYTVDDSYIPYRYIQNLLSGRGLVFNPGERVEGYSNPLWILLLTPIVAVGVSAEMASKAAGILSGLTVLAGVAVWRRRERKRLFTAAVLLSLATSLPFVVWSVAGLETAFYTALLTLGLLGLAEGRSLLVSALLLGLSAGTRPEGGMFCLLGGVYLALRSLKWNVKSGSGDALSGQNRRTMLIAPVFLFGPLIAQLIFRRLYYGTWLTNTFHAKMGISWELWGKGWHYIESFLRWSGPGSLLWLLVLAGGYRLWKRRRRGALLLGWALAAQMMFIISAGGDWMKPYRFFVPILPMLYLLLWEGVEVVLERFPKIEAAPLKRGGIYICVLVLVIGSNLAPWEEVRNYTSTYSEGMRQTSISLGRWLAREAEPGDWVALGDVGALPYYSGLNVIDLYGLVNPEIARLPGPALYSQGIDAEAILNRRPQYIVLESRTENAFQGLKQVDRKLFLEPRFRKEYVLIQKARFSPSEVTFLFQRRRAKDLNE